ncbi:hypothetical protein ACWGS8_22935, partial [Mesorhizobium sp. 43Arga]
RAIDAEAERYWQSWGFIPARDNPSVLMRSIQDVSLWRPTKATRSMRVAPSTAAGSGRAGLWPAGL